MSQRDEKGKKKLYDLAVSIQELDIVYTLATSSVADRYVRNYGHLNSIECAGGCNGPKPSFGRKLPNKLHSPRVGGTIPVGPSCI